MSSLLSASGSLLTRKLSWPLAALLVLSVFVIGNILVIVGSATPQWDAADFFGPQFTLVADHVKAHHLVMWNPWSAAGSPEFAEPELGTTSPLMLLFGYLPLTPQGDYIAYWLTVWAFGGLGMLLLAKHLGAPVWGGTVVAVGFVTCGFYMGHAEHMSSIYSVSFVPWIVWRFDSAFGPRRWWCAMEAGVLFGLSALGGYPAFTILTGFFLGLWALGRILFLQESGDWRGVLKKAIAALAITMVLGGLVCSPSYVGFLRSTAGFSDRNGPRSREESVSSNLLEAGALSTAASPYLAVLNLPPQLWPKTDVSMTSVYMGAGVVVLALVAACRRIRWRWWLAGIFGLFLLCALGDQLPVRGLLYDLVPPTRYFRNPALFRFYFLFITAVLACFGARDIENSKVLRERTVFFALAALAAYAAIATFEAVTHGTAKQLPLATFALLHVLVMWLGYVYVAWRFRWRELPKQSLAVLFIAFSLFDGVATLWLSRPTLYSSAANPFWQEMNAGHRYNLNLGAQGLGREYLPPQQLGTYPNNRNVVLKVPILQSYTTLKNRYFDALLADADLRAMAMSANRFWFSAHPVWMAPDDPAFAKFAASVKTLRTPTLVLHKPELMLKIGQHVSDSSGGDIAITPTAACSLAQIANVDYEPNLLAFDYSAPEAGWLLVTDRWASGWHLQVNQTWLPLTGADFLFRAVPVQPGTNHVRFTYAPAGFYLTLAISWSILGLTLAWELVRWFRGRNRSRVYA